jgi:hypothetical protein
MTLRVRKPASQGTPTSPDRKRVCYTVVAAADANADADADADALSSLSPPGSTAPETAPAAVTKKLPRVILKVGPRPET